MTVREVGGIECVVRLDIFGCWVRLRFKQLIEQEACKHGDEVRQHDLSLPYRPVESSEGYLTRTFARTLAVLLPAMRVLACLRLPLTARVRLL